ncbi:DUF4190 domain-containing protein [Paenibacillus puldeungensis]|uniref:DUF4190 domain-containing protein n=1 Tax=Paenibacillus puldeungensis TaxID=696536 RepID=A0ABW3RRT1_9BACL
MDQLPSETPYQYSTFNNYPPNQPQLPPKTNGKSIASLVLGILSIMLPYIGFILGIVAIVFSTISFKELKKSNDQGKGMSIAGLVCGIVGTVLYGLIILFVIIALLAYSASNNVYTNF